jgi:hypothetical protein
LLCEVDGFGLPLPIEPAQTAVVACGKSRGAVIVADFMPQDPPRITIFAIAMTSGVLLALAAHVLAARFGIGLTSAWRDPIPTDPNALRSAFGWWSILAAGYAGSFLTGLLVQMQARDRRSRRRLQPLIPIVFFLILAGAPHLAVDAPSASLPVTFGVNLSVFGLGIVTAFCGSWFAISR